VTQPDGLFAHSYHDRPVDRVLFVRREIMKKLILATVSAVALFGIAACSDSTDNTTTQSTTPPATETMPETTPPAAAPETPAPETGTGGTTQPAAPAQ
jgi:hypothetical protein